MLPVRWSEPAIHDLFEVLDYVEQRNPHAARALEADIRESANRLSTWPYMGRAGRVSGTREHLIRPTYLLVYSVDEAVEILRMLHTRLEYP